jgi:crotonobetainyl-CoA:carnitine CoA-transferase CaiB-like acyl-CoA transferase
VGALDGIRVIEAGLLVQAPQAASTLAQWGADVIKVELPVIGDQSRWLPVEPGDARSAYFIGCNRGKRSVTIDLRTPDGREVFLRLAETADVVVSNFAPGTMDGWGVGADDVLARNPRVIYAAGTTFGTEGEGSRREGADLSAQAAGGLIATTGRPGGEPTPVGVTIADHIASQNLVGGILAALLSRERTGAGQAVATSLLGGQIWAQASEYTAALIRGVASGPANRSHPMIPAIYGIFPTADGWIGIVGVTATLRAAFFEALGRPDLTARFDEPLITEDVKAELWPLLDEAFAGASTAEWCERFRAIGVRHAPVRDHAEVIADPEVWANGYLANVDGVDIVPAPVAFSATPAAPGAAVPDLGQHTDEVLAELGLTPDEVAALRATGAI